MSIQLSHGDLLKQDDVDAIVNTVMELLATVHWVAHYEADANSPEGALAAIGLWNSRKKKLMQPAHVNVAWERLAATGWLAPERSVALR